MTPAARARAHELLDEFLDLLAADAGEMSGERPDRRSPPTPKPRPRAKRAARVRRPLHPPDDVARMAAKKMLRRRGMT